MNCIKKCYVNLDLNLIADKRTNIIEANTSGLDKLTFALVFCTICTVYCAHDLREHTYCAVILIMKKQRKYNHRSCKENNEKHEGKKQTVMGKKLSSIQS